MVDKYESTVCNSVWDVVLRLKNKSIVSSYWVYKVKKVIDGSVEKYKARFVSHGFSQVARTIMLLQYISTEEKDVDILTKALSKCKFEFHRDRIGVADNPFLFERES